MGATDRIPVSEETHTELHDIKEQGQTYDDLISGLLREHKQRKLMDHLDAIEENSEFVPLDEIDDEASA